MRAGRGIELIVAALNKHAELDPNFKVESPAYLKDFVTGKQREIDVIVTYTNGNKSFRARFECKDIGKSVS